MACCCSRAPAKHQVHDTVCTPVALFICAGADWEGVVLIPFIDQDRLLAAAASVHPERLTPEERQRNTLGDILVFSHAPGSCGGGACSTAAVAWSPSERAASSLAHVAFSACCPALLSFSRCGCGGRVLHIHPARPLCIGGDAQQPRRGAGGAAAAARWRPRLRARGASGRVQDCWDLQ